METWQSVQPNMAYGTGVTSLCQNCGRVGLLRCWNLRAKTGVRAFQGEGLVGLTLISSTSISMEKMAPSRWLTFPPGKMDCLCVFQGFVLLYKCEQNTNCRVFALESFTPQGERVGVAEDCKLTIVLAPFVWFPYYTIIFSIIVLFLLSFG